VNICLLIPDQLDKPMGGMGVLCRGILENLPSHDFNITVVGTRQASPATYNFCTYKEVNSVNLMVGQTDPIIFSFLNQMAYVDALDEVPDIVHCFDWSTFGAGIYLKQKYNCKLICSVQLALSDITTRINPLQQVSFDHGRALEIQGLAEADVIVQVSRHYAKKYFMFLNKTVVINNGIDLGPFKNKETINDLPGEGLRLLYIGRYAEMKNTHTLSSITLPKNVSLLFAGTDSGSDPDVWKLTIKNIKQNPQMHYIGPFYGEGKVKLFNSVDGVIFPSLREPFGIVGLEALAAKKVLLSSWVDGMKDYLNDSNSIYCGTTKESIEESINKWSGLDSNIRDQYIQNGHNTCQNFTWTKQAFEYFKLYNLLK
jgi:glycosyltransferase involved in cell wall biosynthesis